METAYTIVGLFFIFSVSLVMTGWAIAYIIFQIKHRKEIAYSEWAKGVCSNIDRWCNYEFPIAGFMAREISNSISSGWSFDPDQFREKIRNKVWEKEKP